MTNAVTHFEILGPDGPALHRFYADLFGWKIEDMGAEMGHYGLVDTRGGEGINGGVGQPNEGGPSTTVYVEVTDPQATLDEAVRLGGRVVAPVMEIPNVVTFAVFADRQGAVVGVTKAEAHEHAVGEEHDHGPSKGDGVPAAWFEITSADPKDGRRFYEDLFGWKVSREMEGEMTYFHLALDEAGLQGAIGSSRDGAPHVTVWMKTSDLDGTLQRASELGGQAVMQPMKMGETLRMAGFTDPAGNFIGLFNR